VYKADAGSIQDEQKVEMASRPPLRRARPARGQELAFSRAVAASLAGRGLHSGERAAKIQIRSTLELPDPILRSISVSTRLLVALPRRDHSRVGGSDAAQVDVAEAGEPQKRQGGASITGAEGVFDHVDRIREKAPETVARASPDLSPTCVHRGSEIGVVCPPTPDSDPVNTEIPGDIAVAAATGDEVDRPHLLRTERLPLVASCCSHLFLPFCRSADDRMTF
jgi:hypothetical protein